MFEFHTKEFTTDLALNHPTTKKIEIDEGVSCFILIDSQNKKIIQPLLNRIVDYILDNVTSKDVYGSFWVSLESINFFIKTLQSKESSLESINMVIGILEHHTFHFSKIGQGSCYMISAKKEFVEVSDKNIHMTLFDYISSGKLSFGEKIVMTNMSISEYFTSQDIKDISQLDTIKQVDDTIIKILEDEKIDSNIILESYEYRGEYKEVTEVNLWTKVNHTFYKLLDNNYTKRIFAYWMMIGEKIEKRGKLVKNILFFSWIILSAFLLFWIISGLVGTKVENSKVSTYKADLVKAREYIRLANDNLTNPELFDLNIKKAEELVSGVKQEKLFEADIATIEDDISIIKKQFNGVEIFGMDTTNLLFSGDFTDAVKLLEVNKKLYVLTKSSLVGPLVSGQEIKSNIFGELEVDDEFIDATVAGDNIIMVTKKNRVVKFGKTQKFKYVNVIGQDLWEGSSFVTSYNGNLYMTNKEGNQVFKHSASAESYTNGVPYFTDADSKAIGKVLSVWIDGGIYVLKGDLSMVKFFSAPKYRLESIVLNKLPDTYKLEDGKASIILSPLSNYVYILLNKKIWVFQPNTKVFTDTKSLLYLGQIEGKWEAIEWFYIPRDGEIEVLTKKGIYKLNFEVINDKLNLR